MTQSRGGSRAWWALKRVAGSLPRSLQQELKRQHFRRRIRRGEFRADEPEFDRLAELVSPGDWVLDIGANIGFYTLRLSGIVGGKGRVIAFEPVPATFELLAANCAYAACANVTLVNAAVSSAPGLVHMTLPTWQHAGNLPNPYRAQITEDATASGGFDVLSLSIDALQVPSRVGFVKIDVEGHELEVVRGMSALIARDRPVILAEGTAANAFLEGLGYQGVQAPSSPNTLLRPAR